MPVIADALVRIGTDLSPLERGLRRAQNQISAFGDKLQKAGAKLLQAGVSIGAFGGIAVKAFADFDKSLTRSTAIMGNLSQQTVASMDQIARALSTQLPFSASKLAEAYFFLASAGLDAQQSMAALPTVARFAAAGAFDLSLATDLLTDAQTALGLSSKDAAENLRNMTRVADVLVKANTLANATTEQFSRSLTNMAAAAGRIVGKDVEEIVAMLAAFAERGIKGEEAGMRVAIVLRDLQRSAQKAKDVFQSLGIDVFDPLTGQMRNVADIFGDLERALSGASDETKRMILTQLKFQDRSVQSILVLLGASDAIRKYETELRNAGGTTEQVARFQMQALSAQLHLVWNRVTLVAIQLGRALAPAVRNIAVAFAGVLRIASRLISIFDNLGDTVKTIAVGTVAAAVAGGGLLLAFGAIAKAVSALIPLVLGLMRGLSLLSAAFGGPLGLLTMLGGAAAAMGVWAIATRKSTSELERLERTARELDVAPKIQRAASEVRFLQLELSITEKRIERLRDALARGITGGQLEPHGRDIKDFNAELQRQTQYAAQLREQLKSATGALDALQKTEAETAKTARELNLELDAFKKARAVLGSLEDQMASAGAMARLFARDQTIAGLTIATAKANVETLRSAIEEYVETTGVGAQKLLQADEAFRQLTERFRQAETELENLQREQERFERSFTGLANSVDDAAASISSLDASIRDLQLARAATGAGLIEILGLEEGELSDRLSTARAQIAAFNEQLIADQTSISDQLGAFWGDFTGTLASSFQSLGAQVGQFVTGMIDQLTTGIGNTISQIVVYGESVSDAFKRFGKQIASFIISSLIKIGAQLLVWFTLGQTLLGKKASAEMAVATSLAAAWAVVASIRELGLIGIATAPAFATAATSITAAQAAAGAAVGATLGATIAKGGAALLQHGGLVTGPTMALVGEKGPELVVPLDSPRALGDGRPTLIQLILDGRVLAESTIDHLSDAVSLKLGRLV